MAIVNKVICPEDKIEIVLRADMIPDRAVVTKRTGDVQYVLRHSLKLYTFDASPVDLDGFFLVSKSGDINQIYPGKRLCWIISAEDFVHEMQRSWTESRE